MPVSFGMGISFVMKESVFESIMKIPELLAPAGNMEAFYAAAANGADAIYVGGSNYSARAQAGNFTDEEMAAAISYAHFHNVKVYCAVNTLISDSEMPAVLDYIRYLYETGIDAVIVQDYGLLCAVRRLLPQLDVNASTQMTAHNLDSVSFLEKQGIKRVILSRELSCEDIERISSASACETEVFVHGALCVCYSGQCLMSSMIGGRSGNRGRCAQPCRLPYTLLDEKGREVPVKSGEYLLSPKDLFGITAIDELLETGVDSLKIEGRMKRPEYVAVVTDNYRRLLDARAAENNGFDEEASLAELKQIFNRDHAAGYLLGNLGGELCSGKKPNNRGVFLGRVENCINGRLTLRLDMPIHSGDGLEIWVTKGGRSGFLAEDLRQKGKPVDSALAGELIELNFSGKAFRGDRVFKTNDSLLMQKALCSFREEKVQPLSMQLIAHLGENPVLKAWDTEDNEALFADNEYIIAEAIKRPADAEYIRGQLSRLGGSGFYLDELQLDIDENIMLPASVLNNLRRQCTEQVRAKRLAKGKRSCINKAAFERNKKELLAKASASKSKANPKLAAWVENEAQALQSAQNGADIIYYEENIFSRKAAATDYAVLKKRLKGYGAKLYPVLPQIYLDSEKPYWQKQIALWSEAGIEGVRCDSLGAVELAKECGFSGMLCGGMGLNVFNSFSACCFADAGLKSLQLSSELSVPQLANLRFNGEKEVVVHGAAQLMVSQYCLLGGAAGGRTSEKQCSRPCELNNAYMLQDKKGYSFPIRCDRFCRMHLFNARELCMLSDIEALKKAGINIFTLDLRLYDKTRAGEITSLYQRALAGGEPEILMQEIEKLKNSGFTKGHFYRGVCDGQ